MSRLVVSLLQALGGRLEAGIELDRLFEVGHGQVMIRSDAG
jgi:hypothetical protein